MPPAPCQFLHVLVLVWRQREVHSGGKGHSRGRATAARCTAFPGCCTAPSASSASLCLTRWRPDFPGNARGSRQDNGSGKADGRGTGKGCSEGPEEKDGDEGNVETKERP